MIPSLGHRVEVDGVVHASMDLEYSHRVRRYTGTPLCESPSRLSIPMESLAAYKDHAGNPADTRPVECRECLGAIDRIVDALEQVRSGQR